MATLPKIDLNASESDVEQKFIVPLLLQESPDGLGYSETDFRTKVDIRKLAIDKGNSKKLYYPDYAIVCDGLPLLIIEAKTPGQDLNEAMREARLYAAEINASYPKGVNPCERIFATDGLSILAGFWDQGNPILELAEDDFDSLSPKFDEFLNFASHSVVRRRAKEILRGIRTTARYFKPVYMLGGRSVANEVIGDNSFGTNVSIEYKYLFNPDSPNDRAAVVKNAYVASKRKQAHVSPIDRLIRTALPRKVVDARPIEDSKDPSGLIDAVASFGRHESEICLLIGSVGSGKSTFTDFLRLEALPQSTTNSTEWVNINLNKAPLTRDLIYKWVMSQAIEGIKKLHTSIDFDDISTIQKIFIRELAIVEKGKASIFEKGSARYKEAIYLEIDRLQQDVSNTLSGIINFLYKYNNKLLVIVLDNCDKRNRDDQLLMFEVASWIKSTFPCMVFLPLRDTTYDQYRNEPPLDTVIKDLIFRIDPPLLDRVIQARLNYALREISNQQGKFSYVLPNGMRVECARIEVAAYLKSIITSLFQDQLFKRIISGLAGRNIRKGLEILLDFCKSGHIGVDDILRIRTTNGEYHLPNHVIAKILLKGKRKYYSDLESNIKNLFSAEETDDLPDPFVRIAILQWLKNRWRESGPNRIIGFHQAAGLISDLQAAGHSEHRVVEELNKLISYGCIFCEAQTSVLSYNDLISIAPAGQIHLDLLRNVNYLSAISEDVLFRENQVAKQISDNISGRGKFRVDSRATVISNGLLLIDYLLIYKNRFFVGPAKVMAEEKFESLVNLEDIKEYVRDLRDNDSTLRSISKMEVDYPVGTEVEGQIVSVQNYGVFVDFGLDGSGLIHKSNFGNIGTRITDQFESGDWVVVQILGYHAAKRSYDLKLVGISTGNQFEVEAQTNGDQ